VREFVRELWQKGVVKDPNFCEAELGLLDAPADGKKVHVAKRRFSRREGQADRKAIEYDRITTIT
jgi:hypothetical protein